MCLRIDSPCPLLLLLFPPVVLIFPLPCSGPLLGVSAACVGENRCFFFQAGGGYGWRQRERRYVWCIITSYLLAPARRPYRPSLVRPCDQKMGLSLRVANHIVLPVTNAIASRPGCVARVRESSTGSPGIALAWSSDSLSFFNQLG